MPRSDKLPGVADTDLKPYIKQVRREASFIFRLGIVVSAWFFVVSPLLTIFVPLPLFFLPERLRERHAQKAASHPLYLVRQSCFMVKMVAGLRWAADPEVRRRLGLQPLPPDPGTWREGE